MGAVRDGLSEREVGVRAMVWLNSSQAAVEARAPGNSFAIGRAFAFRFTRAFRESSFLAELRVAVFV